MKSNTFTLIDKKIFVIGNYIILMESHWYLNLSENYKSSMPYQNKKYYIF